jgi:hypothetical protein
MQADMSHAFLFSPAFLILVLFCVIIAIVPYWFIFKKAGFSPWLSLLTIVPFLNLLVLYIVAFTQWKVVPAASGHPQYPACGGTLP